MHARSREKALYHTLGVMLSKYYTLIQVRLGQKVTHIGI